MSKKLLLSIVVLAASAFIFNIQAATFELTPATGSFTKGCTRSVDIYIDAATASSNAADLFLNYPNSQISAASFVNGNAYQTYIVSPTINNGATSQVRVTAFSIAPDLTGKKLFGKLSFTSVPTATAANFTVEFTLGNTTDSNIADSNTSQDILTSVVNGSYTFAAGDCNPDNSGPTVDFVNPTNGQTNVVNTNPFIINVLDNVGVDLNTVVIVINGESFTATSPGVVVTGQPKNYKFSILTTTPFPPSQASVAAVTAKDVAGNSVNRQIAFNIPVPVPVETVCPSEVNLPPNVVNILQSIGVTAYPPGTSAPVLELGTVGTAALVTVIAAGINLLPLVAFLATPGLLFTIFGYLAGKRSKKPWGLVLDHSTGAPVPLAIVRVYMAGTLNIIAQTVSDQDGRYGFTLTPGDYRIYASKTGYANFEKEISILPGESSFVMDIKLSAKNNSYFINRFSFNYLRIKLAKSWNLLFPYIISFGTALALVSVILVPSLINWLVLGVYILILLLKLLSNIDFKLRYASVSDSTNDLRIPNASIKIFDLNTWVLVDTVSTNSAGLFDFYGTKGEYGVLVTARGYTFPSKAKNSFPLVEGKYKGIVKINLNKGRNNIALFMDQAGYGNESNSNLASPFN